MPEPGQKDVITIGQVGLGHWGPNVLRNFARLADSRVKICCDLDPQALNRVQAAYSGLLTTGDYEQLLDDPELDAIVVTASAPAHYDLSRAALERGKHVFVEKPMALRVGEAEELVALAHANDLRLMVGHLLLYHPAVQRLKAYIEAGELGTPRYVYSQRLNLGQVRRDENAMWSLAPHDISVALYLLAQEPVTVSAVGRDFLRTGIEDLVFLTMHFADGALAHCHVSWLDPHKVRRITVVGSEKMAVFDDMAPREKLRIFDQGVDFPDVGYSDLHTLRFGDIYVPRIDMREPLAVECQHFLSCVQEGKEPLTDGQNGLAVLRVLAAAQESLDHEGTKVSLASLQESA
ncbi:MAG: Gfo/Idh/MocA family protein [Anaerolineae bacterium]